jgi:hypothetical protein
LLGGWDCGGRGDTKFFVVFVLPKDILLGYHFYPKVHIFVAIFRKITTLPLNLFDLINKVFKRK